MIDIHIFNNSKLPKSGRVQVCRHTEGTHS